VIRPRPRRRSPKHACCHVCGRAGNKTLRIPRAADRYRSDVTAYDQTSGQNQMSVGPGGTFPVQLGRSDVFGAVENCGVRANASSAQRYHSTMRSSPRAKVPSRSAVLHPQSARLTIPVQDQHSILFHCGTECAVLRNVSHCTAQASDPRSAGSVLATASSTGKEQRRNSVMKSHQYLKHMVHVIHNVVWSSVPKIEEQPSHEQHCSQIRQQEYVESWGHYQRRSGRY